MNIATTALAAIAAQTEYLGRVVNYDARPGEYFQFPGEEDKIHVVETTFPTMVRTPNGRCFLYSDLFARKAVYVGMVVVARRLLHPIG